MTNKVKNTAKHGNPSTKVRSELWEEYFNLKSLKKEPINHDWLVRFTNSLRDFADKPDSLYIEDFFFSHGMPHNTFHKLCERHEMLAAMAEYAMTKIGIRRDRGVLEGEFDGAQVRTTLGFFWKTYKTQREWEAKLRSEANGDATSGTFNLIMSQINPADCVKPDKKEDK